MTSDNVSADHTYQQLEAVLGGDVVQQLAEVAVTQRVTISIQIFPHDEPVGDAQ